MNDKEKLNKEETLELTFDYFQRTLVHYAMWYAEVKDQLGPEKAITIMENAWQKSFAIQMKRLSKTLEFEMEGKFPRALVNLSMERLNELKKSVAINWLANDGVWFQSVEFSENMLKAKGCNDAAWSHFSPYEAIRIKSLLGLGAHPGLEGLKKAFNYRLYSDVNKQSIVNETENSFDFYMNECRVQVARKRKGLDDYPCKSAGIIEYSTFASTIDSHIKTTLISCPPDKHPDTYYCGWHFYIEEK